MTLDGEGERERGRERGRESGRQEGRRQGGRERTAVLLKCDHDQKKD